MCRPSLSGREVSKMILLWRKTCQWNGSFYLTRKILFHSPSEISKLTLEVMVEWKASPISYFVR